MPAALPQATASAVKGEQRRQDEARREIGARGRRRRYAEGVGGQRLTALPSEEARGAGAAFHARQANGAPGLGECGQQRSAIYLAADGPVAGDGGKLGEFERKVFDQLQRRIAGLKRSAFGAHGHARIGFGGFEVGVHVAPPHAWELSNPQRETKGRVARKAPLRLATLATSPARGGR